MAVDYAPLDEDEDKIVPKVILPEKSLPVRAAVAPQVKAFNNDSTECNYLIIGFIICVLFIINE
tara:strand:+ start:4954 stop:5145 length:192 start_codon:yes stop_codon:yes gene_type:complete